MPGSNFFDSEPMRRGSNSSGFNQHLRRVSGSSLLSPTTPVTYASADNFTELVEQTHQEIKEHLSESISRLLDGLRQLQDSCVSAAQIDQVTLFGKPCVPVPATLRQPANPERVAATNSNLIKVGVISKHRHSDPQYSDLEETLVIKEPEGAPSEMRPDALVVAWSGGQENAQDDNDSDATAVTLVTEVGEVQHDGSEDGVSEPSEEAILFEVLDVWRKTTKHLAAKMGSDRSTVSGERLQSGITQNHDENDNGIGQNTKHLLAKGVWAKIVLDPQSRTRFAWESFSIVLVLYDIIWLPLLLFEPPKTDLTEFLSWCCRLFWTQDILMTLITGYMSAEGLIDFRPLFIAKRYLKTWFGLDLLVVGVDWLELLFEEAQSGGFARIGRVGRIFRMARMVRLLRLLRLQSVLQQMLENFRSEWIKEVTVLFKILLVILGLGHFFACIWYGIGAREDEVHTWVKSTFVARHGLGYRYATSLHYSLSQFSGGLDFIEAENFLERVYCVLTWTFGFTLGAVMISALTSSWTQLNILAKDKTQKMTILRKYLTDNKIPYKLANRLQRNAQHALIEMDRTRPEHSVDLLNLVSAPLRMELHFELYYRILKSHIFFERCGLMCYSVTQKICHLAATIMNVSEGDVVFNVGEIPPRPKMIFVQSGRLKYFDTAQLARGSSLDSPVPHFTPLEDSLSNSDRSSHSSEQGSSHRYTNLELGHWIAEPFLWTHWMCRGLLMATADSQLVLVDAQTFQEVLGRHYDDTFNPKIYAAEFVKELNQSESELSDITFGKEERAMERFDKFMQEKTRRSRSSRRTTHASSF